MANSGEILSSNEDLPGNAACERVLLFVIGTLGWHARLFSISNLPAFFPDAPHQ